MKKFYLDTRVLKFQRFITLLHGRVIRSHQHSSRFLCNNKCPFNIWLRSVVLWVLSTEASRLLWVRLRPGQHTSLPAASGSPQATYLPRRPLAQSGAQIRLAHVSEGLPDAEVSRLCSLSDTREKDMDVKKYCVVRWVMMTVWLQLLCIL